MAGRTPKDPKGSPETGERRASRKKASKKASKKKAVRKKKTTKKVAKKVTIEEPPPALPAPVAAADPVSEPAPEPAPPAPPTVDPVDAGATEGDPLDRFFFQSARTGLEPALEALSSAPEAGWREALEADGIEAFLTFRMGVEWYAVRISALQEIVKSLPLTPVPRTPEHVVGVVTLRGTVLPVLDLHLRLGIERPSEARTTRLLVLDTSEGPAAFMVEEVGGVWRPQDPVLEPPPSSLGARGDLIETLLRADDRVLPLLDLEASLAVEFEGRGRGREARGG